MPTRREFLWSTGALLGPALAPARAVQPAVVSTDAGRLRRRLERLSQFGRPAGGTFADGVSRVAYSEADLAARAWLLDEMRGAGLTSRIDAAGNIFARLGGRPSAPPILFGSHIDSVPNGGNFDGDLGTLAALEVLETARTGQAFRSEGFRGRGFTSEPILAFSAPYTAADAFAGVVQGALNLRSFSAWLEQSLAETSTSALVLDRTGQVIASTGPNAAALLVDVRELGWIGATNANAVAQFTEASVEPGIRPARHVAVRACWSARRWRSTGEAPSSRSARWCARISSCV